MSTSLSTLLTDLADEMGDTVTTGTADSNTTTTYVVDSARTESDADWNNAHIYIDTDAASAAPEGEERRITDFVAASDRIVVFPAFSVAVTTGDTYSIREVFSRDQYKKSINHSIRMATEWWPDIKLTFPVASQAVTGTATSAGTDSLTDSGKAWTADEHIGRYVVIYAGTGKAQRRRILDNTTTKLVVPLWNTTPDTTSKYRIEEAGPEHIVICSTQMDYPLPPGCKHIYAAWIEIVDTEEMGTATSTAATTLTDSGQSWTADEHIGRYVVIYDGTGRGQTRLITDNDTTSITVPTWTITPSTDSKYKIKNPAEVTTADPDQDSQWSRIYNAEVDIAGGYIRFPGQHTEGAWVRLKFEADPLELDSSSDVTNVPEEYILFKAASYLWAKKVGRQGFDNARVLMEWHERQAESYAVTHRRRKPYGTIWQWDDVETVHSYDSPFRGT